MAEIVISNKMTSNYKLMNGRESNLRFEIITGTYYTDNLGFKIASRATFTKNLGFSVEVKHKGINNGVNFLVQPRIRKNMRFKIEVKPSNKMMARYDLIEPPVHTWKTFPVQDSYTLSQAPYSSINFGGNNSMILGSTAKGVGTPFVQFNIGTLEKEIRVKSAKLKLYYNQLNNTNINLYKVGDPWQEYNITYLNQSHTNTLVTNQYTVNTTERYIEFDVADTVTGWTLGLKNNGFCLTSPNNASTIFSTRESTPEPELIVEYYKIEPINIGNSRQEFSITARQAKTKNVRFSIGVQSFFKQSELGFTIHAHDPKHIYNSDLGFSLAARRNDVGFSIGASIQEKSTCRFEISVAEYGYNDMPFSIEVKSYEKESDLGFIVTRGLKGSSTQGFIIESRKVYKTGIKQQTFVINALGKYKPKDDSMKFTLEVHKDYKPRESNLGFIIGSRDNVNTTLGFVIDSVVNYKEKESNLGFKLGVHTDTDDILGFSIAARRSDIGFKIAVPTIKDSNQPFAISARQLTADDLRFIITIGIPDEDNTSSIYIM